MPPTNAKQRREKKRRNRQQKQEPALVPTSPVEETMQVVDDLHDGDHPDEEGLDETDGDRDPAEPLDLRAGQQSSHAECIGEWEKIEPLANGLGGLSIRRLADAIRFGDVAVSLAEDDGKAFDLFVARHGKIRTALALVDRELSQTQVAPEALVAKAIQDFVSRALDRELTAEILRLPDEIRRAVVEFRGARTRRSAMVRSHAEACRHLEGLDIKLDEAETDVRQNERLPTSESIYSFRELVASCRDRLESLTQIETNLRQVNDRLQEHQAAYLGLCSRSSRAITAVEQVRAAANMLGILLLEPIANQMERAIRALSETQTTYNEEMAASFGLPDRSAPVHRLESGLASREYLLTSLSRPRAQSVFVNPPADREEEIRHLVLLALAITCRWQRMRDKETDKPRGRGFNTTIDVLLRRGCLLEEEREQAVNLTKNELSTEWRQNYFDHAARGPRIHLYCPNTMGYELAEKLVAKLVDRPAFEDGIRLALKNHDDEFYAKRAEHKKAAAS